MKTERKWTAVFPATMLLICGVAFLLAATTSCRQVPGHAPSDAQWSPPAGVTVTVQGLEGAWFLERASTFLPPICCGASNVPPVVPPGLPVRDGDYLAVLPDKAGSQDKTTSVFLYRHADGSALVFELAPRRLILNRRTIMLDLGEDQQGWTWLMQASTNELADLRHVLIPEALGTNTALVAVRSLLLHKLAHANPGVGLMCESGTNPVLRSALAGFRPRTLICGSPDNAAVTGLLQAFERPSQLEILMLTDAKNLTSLAFLGELPALRNLSLCDDWNPTKTGPIPETCAGLRALNVSIKTDDKLRLENIASRESLAGIESLGIGVKDGINLDGLADLRKLREFSLCCDTNVDLRLLQHLPRLTALGVSLDKDAAPGAFADLLKRLPRIRYLEVYAHDKENPANLAPVASLPELESLTVIGSFDPGSLPLQKLRNLRFLALSPKLWENKGFATQITQFQQAHPDCRVVTCEPICLGSGWVLLLALAAAVSCWVRGRRRGVAS